MISGFIPLNKPVGITSQQAVSRVKKIIGCKKAGHTGTLDPAAQGLLIVALGKATRLSEYFLNGDKGYRAEVMLGSQTDTGDREGNITAQVPEFAVEPEDITSILRDFSGLINQTPPQASAIKINGQRAYNLFRQGKGLEMPARQVTIKSIQALGLDGPLTQDNPVLTIDVVCSKGTYIRSLAVDIGAALGLPAHLSGLTRTSLSQISLEQAADFIDLEQDYNPWLLDLSIAVAKMPKLQVDREGLANFLHGRTLEADSPDGEIAVFSGSRLLGIGKATAGTIKPVKVLAQE